MRQPALAEHQIADPQSLDTRLTRQAIGQRNSQRLTLDLFLVLHHLVGLPLRALYAQVADAKWLQVHIFQRWIIA